MSQHEDFKVGDRVSTPKGEATVTDIFSNGIRVRLSSGSSVTFSINPGPERADWNINFVKIIQPGTTPAPTPAPAPSPTPTPQDTVPTPTPTAPGAGMDELIRWWQTVSPDDQEQYRGLWVSIQQGQIVGANVEVLQAFIDKNPNPELLQQYFNLSQADIGIFPVGAQPAQPTGAQAGVDQPPGTVIEGKDLHPSLAGKLFIIDANGVPKEITPEAPAPPVTPQPQPQIIQGEAIDPSLAGQTFQLVNGRLVPFTPTEAPLPPEVALPPDEWLAQLGEGFEAEFDVRTQQWVPVRIPDKLPLTWQQRAVELLSGEGVDLGNPNDPSVVQAQQLWDFWHQMEPGAKVELALQLSTSPGDFVTYWSALRNLELPVIGFEAGVRRFPLAELLTNTVADALGLPIAQDPQGNEIGVRDSLDLLDDVIPPPDDVIPPPDDVIPPPDDVIPPSLVEQPDFQAEEAALATAAQTAAAQTLQFQPGVRGPGFPGGQQAFDPQVVQAQAAQPGIRGPDVPDFQAEEAALATAAQTAAAQTLQFQPGVRGPGGPEGAGSVNPPGILDAKIVMSKTPVMLGENPNSMDLVISMNPDEKLGFTPLSFEGGQVQLLQGQERFQAIGQLPGFGFTEQITKPRLVPSLGTPMFRSAQQLRFQVPSEQQGFLSAVAQTGVPVQDFLAQEQQQRGSFGRRPALRFRPSRVSSAV